MNPGNASIFREECYSIGVEIKVSLEDLYRNPLQINSYFGKTDYIFLCVPQKMINDAMQYAGVEDRLGGGILIQVKYTNFLKDRQERIPELQSFACCSCRLHFCLARIPESMVFVNVEGIDECL